MHLLEVWELARRLSLSFEIARGDECLSLNCVDGETSTTSTNACTCHRVYHHGIKIAAYRELELRVIRMEADANKGEGG